MFSFSGDRHLLITQLGSLAWVPGVPICPHCPIPHTFPRFLVLIGKVTQTGSRNWGPQRHFKVEVSIIRFSFQKGHRKGAQEAGPGCLRAFKCAPEMDRCRGVVREDFL